MTRPEADRGARRQGRHTSPAQVARDHERDLALRAIGCTVIRYTWAQVTYEPDAVAADLRAQIARHSLRSAVEG